MAAFGDRLTVYPDPNALPPNVTSNDPCGAGPSPSGWWPVDPTRPDPRLTDPVLVDSLVQKILAAKVMMPTGMTVQTSSPSSRLPGSR